MTQPQWTYSTTPPETSQPKSKAWIWVLVASAVALTATVGVYEFRVAQLQTEVEDYDYALWEATETISSCSSDLDEFEESLESYVNTTDELYSAISDFFIYGDSDTLFDESANAASGLYGAPTRSGGC